METIKKQITKQMTNSMNRKLAVKNFIAKVLTQSLLSDKEINTVGFKDKLKTIMNPGTRRRSYESSMEKIKEMSEQMDYLIMFLDEKMDNMLEKREKEFLSAYQSHMIEVQKELLTLKQKANEKELKLQQDDKILSLEQELAWIREETMKLREEIDNQEALLIDVKLENQELEDDAKFLKDQLKEGKAANTKLKVALSKSHNKYEGLIREARAMNKQIPKDLIDRDPYSLGIDFSQEEAQTSQMESALQEESKITTDMKSPENFDSPYANYQVSKIPANMLPINNEDAVKIDHLLTELYESGKSKDEIIEQISRFCKENKARREKVLELHKKILEKKKRIKARYEEMGSGAQSNEGQKNLVYFMQCVERVKGEVEARRNCDKEVFDKKSKVRVFGINDKRRIMELLLCKEDILTKVLIKIFRKIKIKDIEKKYALEKREAKYRNFSSEGTNSSVRKTGMNQRTNQFDDFPSNENKAMMSYQGNNSKSNKYRKSSQGKTSSMIQYDGSPPVHLLNQEIRLDNKTPIAE